MARPERPIDPTKGPVATFATELRALRQAAGNISYREMSQRALFAPSVLSAAASGHTLPTLRVALAFAEVCGGDLTWWARRWWDTARAAGVPVDPDGNGRWTEPGCTCRSLAR